jgi:hypothetical protein
MIGNGGPLCPRTNGTFRAVSPTNISMETSRNLANHRALCGFADKLIINFFS